MKHLRVILLFLIQFLLIAVFGGLVYDALHEFHSTLNASERIILYIIFFYMLIYYIFVSYDRSDIKPDSPA